MKTLVLSFVLIFMAVSLTAQTGYFDLSFGDEFAVCDSILRSKGLARTDTTAVEMRVFAENVAFTYYPAVNYPSEDHLARVNIYFNAKKPYLTGWVAYYYRTKEPEIAQRLLRVLQAIHDNQLTRSGDTWTVEFNDKRYLEVGYMSDDFYIWYNTK